MLAFQVGDHAGHRDEAFGKPIDITWYRQLPDEVAELLTAAGFEVRSTTVRQAEPEEKTPQGYIMARKPSATGTP